MLIEVLGFVAGVLAISIAAFFAMRHEYWREVRAVRGLKGTRGGTGGNALIWPSH